MRPQGLLVGEIGSSQRHAYRLVSLRLPAGEICNSRFLAGHGGTDSEVNNQPNSHIHHVISDLTGVSGLKMVEAIVGGERNPEALVALCDPQVQKHKAERLREALEGNWKTEKHFTAWLGLAPGSRQSGKRRGSQRRSRNRAGRLFCVIARSVGRSVDKALGGFYRRLKGRKGGLVANLALARKLAELFWRLMVHGVAYVEQGLKKYQEQVIQTEQRLLRKLARK